MSSSLSATSAMASVDDILRGGDLRDYGVVEVLATMHANRLTGALRLRTDRFTASIYTMEGDIIAAESDLPEQQLGERLLRLGHLSQGQLAAARAAVTDTRPLAEVLVEGGDLSQESLEQAQSEQFQDVLFSTFLVHAGRYDVQVMDAVYAENMQLLFDTADLLGEGRKLRDDLSHLVAALSGGDRGLARGSAAGKVLLSAEQKTVMELAERHRTLDALLTHSRLGRIATLKLLTQLLERHALAITKIQMEAPESSGTRVNNLRRDPMAGLFGSEDSVLDKVDLSHIVHFTVATEIPLTGVVETLGAEDVEHTDGDGEGQRTLFVERGEADGVALTPVEEADDTSDELVFTEDGQVTEAAEPVERLGAPISVPRPGKSGRASRLGLTPAQKQTLRRRVQVYNRMFQTLFAHACQHARKAEVVTRFQKVLGGVGPAARPLLTGLEFRTDGTLNPDSLLHNLETAGAQRPFERFDVALHEVASNLLKDAAALLSDPEAETRLREAVLEIRKQLFRPGASAPPLG